MKFIFLIPVILLLFIAGCSSGVDTANMTAADRLAYAEKLYNDEDYLEALNELQALLLQYPGT